MGQGFLIGHDHIHILGKYRENIGKISSPLFHFFGAWIRQIKCILMMIRREGGKNVVIWGAEGGVSVGGGGGGGGGGGLRGGWLKLCILSI